MREAILKIVADSKDSSSSSSGGGGRGRRRGDGGGSGSEEEGAVKVELGPPPEVGIIYR